MAKIRGAKIKQGRKNSGLFCVRSFLTQKHYENKRPCQKSGRQGVLVREAEVKFPPKTGEGAALKARPNSKTASQKKNEG